MRGDGRANGDSILTAHGDNEYVLKSDLFEAVEGYKRLIKESLRPSTKVSEVSKKAEEVRTPKMAERVVSRIGRVVGVEL